MKLDTSVLSPDLKSIAAEARHAESMGYDCLWSSETQHDPFLPLAVAATCTSRIKLGTAICLVVEHDPIVLAKTVATLDWLSNGRVVFGVVRRRSGRGPGPSLAPRM